MRRALSDARRSDNQDRIKRKLAALDQAAQYNFPTADIDQMLREIEAGRASA